ncbi:MAG: hypothetical protein ABUS54_10175 [Actinomycetota bacterium]
MSLHMPHPHAPHLHAPHPHIEEHPWRALPIAMGMIVLLAIVLIVVSFALSKWVAGQAY